MSQVIDRTVTALIAELERQAQEDRPDTPWVEADDPASAMIDGRVDLRSLASQLILAMAGSRGNGSEGDERNLRLDEIEIEDGQVFITLKAEWDEEQLGRERLGPADQVFAMFADKMGQADFEG
jgi:hypothetical protein